MDWYEIMYPLIALLAGLLGISIVRKKPRSSEEGEATRPIRAPIQSLDYPTGKGIYVQPGQRGDFALFPDKDPVTYAVTIGCSFIVHHITSPPEHFALAQQVGLKSWIWSGPSKWRPSTWRESTRRMREKIRSLRESSIAVEGYMADPEDYAESRYGDDSWEANRQDAFTLAESLKESAQMGFKVGLTSFPFWPYQDEIAQIAGDSGAWGSPQLYGIVTPARDYETLKKRADRWKNAQWSAVIPSLAMWDRDASELREYYATFQNEKGVILFPGRRLPSSGPVFETYRDFQVRG